jgi:hypothetical protein
MYGKAIDPWDPKQADEERRQDGLPPVYLRGLRRLLKTKRAKVWIAFCWKSILGILALVAVGSYLRLDGFRAVNLATIQHIHLCRDAAVTLEIAPFSHEAISSIGGTTQLELEAEQKAKESQARKTYSECLLWARSGFGAIPSPTH